MKQIIILLVAMQFFGCTTEPKIQNSEATHARIIHHNGKLGFVTVSDSGSVIIDVQPEYDFIYMYTSNTIRGNPPGFSYRSDREWNDTEYTQVLMDTVNMILEDTMLTNQNLKLLDNTKLIIVQKAGRWGLLYSNGKVAAGFDYDSIHIFKDNITTTYGPMLVMIKNNRAAIMNQRAEIVMSEEFFNKYYPNLSTAAQLHLLGNAFFDGNLLVQQNGKFVDTVAETTPQTIHISRNNNLVLQPIK